MTPTRSAGEGTPRRRRPCAGPWQGSPPRRRRRLEALLAALDESSRPLPAAALWERRAVRVLEQIGSAEARAMLAKLVAGVEKPGLAAEAGAALERAERRK